MAGLPIDDFWLLILDVLPSVVTVVPFPAFSSALPPPMNLFVYGTLLVPEIWDLVTGGDRSPRVEASLADFAIHRVRGATFPAVVRRPGAGPVPGELVRDLTGPVLDRLDAYEDSFYERKAVAVRLCSGGEVLAQVYETPAQLAGEILSDAPWTLEWFRENALGEYLGRMSKGGSV